MVLPVQIAVAALTAAGTEEMIGADLLVKETGEVKVEIGEALAETAETEVLVDVVLPPAVVQAVAEDLQQAVVHPATEEIPVLQEAVAAEAVAAQAELHLQEVVILQAAQTATVAVVEVRPAVQAANQTAVHQAVVHPAVQAGKKQIKNRA